ncbi:ATP-binding protein [Actinoallomurus sp. NPDC050550]|uniref:ATP-binding protein n=1 Tax=Actinoallomurus sp. NPDC050550 TaxID=3154937 RepID=UPI003409F1E6
MSALPTEVPTTMHSPFRPRPERVSRDLQLAARPTAVGAARSFVREQLHCWRLDEPTGYDLPGTTELITSELVTNSLKATGRPQMPTAGSQALNPPTITLRLRLIRRSLFVEVWDASPYPPVPTGAGDLDESGRGLVLVTALAKAWDYYHSDAAAGGKVVWAEIDIPAELAGHIASTGIQHVPPRSGSTPGPRPSPTRNVPRPPAPDVHDRHHRTHPGPWPIAPHSPSPMR